MQNFIKANRKPQKIRAQIFADTESPTQFAKAGAIEPRESRASRSPFLRRDRRQHGAGKSIGDLSHRTAACCPSLGRPKDLASDFLLVIQELIVIRTLVCSNIQETFEWLSVSRHAWTADNVRTLKSLARKKTPASVIARSLKRAEGATRQKAFSLGLSLDSRA